MRRMPLRRYAVRPGICSGKVFCTRSSPMGVTGYSLAACPDNLRSAPGSAMSAVQCCGQARRRDLPGEGGGDLHEGGLCNLLQGAACLAAIQQLGTSPALLSWTHSTGAETGYDEEIRDEGVAC